MNNDDPQLLRKALDAIEDMASKHLHALHGPKMDGPRNETERVLLAISTTATDALNGDEEVTE